MGILTVAGSPKPSNISIGQRLEKLPNFGRRKATFFWQLHGVSLAGVWKDWKARGIKILSMPESQAGLESNLSLLFPIPPRCLLAACALAASPSTAFAPVAAVEIPEGSLPEPLFACSIPYTQSHPAGRQSRASCAACCPRAAFALKPQPAAPCLPPCAREQTAVNVHWGATGWSH
ncbi:hypothetical protein Taro_009941 [Colocasia esculenta]|uniref:Uncharacterized protein n=1 Tax=Colocasia esculenta TaxID=4460 RepID=A0A843U821_COLES|nr:hypothetical protein [Colocasia esculenta]